MSDDQATELEADSADSTEKDGSAEKDASSEDAESTEDAASTDDAESTTQAASAEKAASSEDAASTTQAASAEKAASSERAGSAEKAASTRRAGSGESGRQILSDRVRRDAVKLVKTANPDADARRRRMQSLAGGMAGLLAVVLVVVGYVALNGSRDNDSAGSPAVSPSAAANALPPGADPALGTPPTVTAGSGDVSKLVVTTLIKGTGPAVKAGQNITVNYVGVTYKDGQKFDASWDRGQPATFPIGVGQVIPGWDQGLVGVPVGSRVQLDIPAKLAYGDSPANGAPGGPLRFVVDLLAAQ